jgi:predicted ATPase
LEFLIDFMREVLGEKSEEDFSEDLTKSVQSKVQNHDSVLFNENPMLIILDTVQLMDEASWRLIELIKDECRRIAIILLIQTDSNNQIKIHPEARQFFDETFRYHMNLIKIIDLPPLRVEELNSLIKDIAPKYRRMMIEEIVSMTHI